MLLIPFFPQRQLSHSSESGVSTPQCLMGACAAGTAAGTAGTAVVGLKAGALKGRRPCWWQRIDQVARMENARLFPPLQHKSGAIHVHHVMCSSEFKQQWQDFETISTIPLRRHSATLKNGGTGH